MKILKVGKDGDLEISNKLDADDEVAFSISNSFFDSATEYIGKEDAILVIKRLDGLFTLTTRKDLSTSPIHPTEVPSGEEIMLEAIHHAAQCAYLYATSCEIGDERIKAFGIYEKIRTATRR